MSAAARRRPRTDRPAYAVAGMAATVAGLGAGHLLATWIGTSPVLAVGARAVDLVPAGLKEWAVAAFGTADKAVLIATVALVTVLVGAGAGLAERAREGLGVGVICVLAAVAGVAAATGPAAGQLDFVPSVVAAILAIVLLTRITGLLRRAGRAPGDSGPGSLAPVEAPADPPRHAGGTDVPRRQAMGVSAAALVGGLAAGAVGRQLTRATSSQTITPPPAATPLPPLPSGLEGSIPGLTPWRTPVSDFYRIDTALSVPRVDIGDWRLVVDGDVDRPLTVTLAELLDMPMVEADLTLNCVSNPIGGPYIGSTRFLGVPTVDLLERVGIRPGVEQILSTSHDGMTISTPVEALLDRERGALLAVAMNGAPLPRAHGFPVRMVTPGLYGYVGATKWLTRLTATTYAGAPAYWTVRGWAAKADVQTQARIDVPASRVDAGPVVVAGVAWSQAHRGIRAVDVSIDGGDWQPATLGPDGGAHYWRQWTYTWAAARGDHEVAVRATDGEGTPQTEVVADVIPSGATGLHTISVTVR